MSQDFSEKLSEVFSWGWVVILPIFPLVFCLALLTGCAQSMKQRSDMIDAINNRPNLINYNGTCIVSMFGHPDSASVSVSNGHRTEVWTYKTIGDNKSMLFDRHTKKARYMKITITDNIVMDVSFE